MELSALINASAFTNAPYSLKRRKYANDDPDHHLELRKRPKTADPTTVMQPNERKRKTECDDTPPSTKRMRSAARVKRKTCDYDEGRAIPYMPVKKVKDAHEESRFNDYNWWKVDLPPLVADDAEMTKEI